MPKANPKTTTRRKVAERSAVVPAVPPEAPLTPAEEMQHRELLASIHNLTADLRRHNLNNAVLLAQRALMVGGPLADHFAELGRRFGPTLKQPRKPALRVVQGGIAMAVQS